MMFLETAQKFNFTLPSCSPLNFCSLAQFHSSSRVPNAYLCLGYVAVRHLLFLGLEHFLYLNVASQSRSA